MASNLSSCPTRLLALPPASFSQTTAVCAPFLLFADYRELVTVTSEYPLWVGTTY